MKRLYSDKRVNHRLKESYLPVHEALIKDTYKSSLLIMFSNVSRAMSEKLKAYHKDHLPNRRYFDPNIDTQVVLKPHNDMAGPYFPKIT